MQDAIIIGAGAAGLMAARELRRAGKQVLVLEARDRIGGRIDTLYDTTAGVPVELGAEFIHGDAPETTKLLDEARLVTVQVRGDQYRSDDGELAPQGNVWKRMGRVFKLLDPDRRKDRSFQDFLDRKPGGRRLRDERELARGFVRGYNGADPALISAKSIAQQGDPTEGAANSRRITSGYAALMEYIQRDITDVIRLRCAARRISWGESGAQVIDQDGNSHDAGAVIVTVPLPLLQDDSITFEPGIPAVRKAASQLGMGHVVRVNVIVKERFWEKNHDEVSFVHAPDRPFNVWWTQHPLKAPLITGWSGGPLAIELRESGNVEAAAIRELARAFGVRRKRVEKLVDSIRVYDWSGDPYTRGAYSYAAVGGIRAPRVLARPQGDNLFFAGEATDSESSGTVEGALASGKRAARKVLESL